VRPVRRNGLVSDWGSISDPCCGEGVYKQWNGLLEWWNGGMEFFVSLILFFTSK